jgi:hypothetical protein
MLVATRIGKMPVRTTQFTAVLLTALDLIPGGAHLLELPNKIGLSQDHYITVQQNYRGWALLGIILIAATIANALATLAMRSQPLPMACAATATILIGATLAIFFTWTYPANQATANWMAAPANWETLRAQWEYSHAANAVLTFLALCLTLTAGLAWSR